MLVGGEPVTVMTGLLRAWAEALPKIAAITISQPAEKFACALERTVPRRQTVRQKNDIKGSSLHIRAKVRANRCVLKQVCSAGCKMTPDADTSPPPVGAICLQAQVRKFCAARAAAIKKTGGVG